MDHDLSPQNHRKAAKHMNTDSGYHEMTDNEEAVEPAPVIPPKSPLRSPSHQEEARIQKSEGSTGSTKDGVRDTEESFVSAEEDPASKAGSRNITQETACADEENSEEQINQSEVKEMPNSANERQSHPFSVSAETDDGLAEAADYIERHSPAKQETREKPSPTSDRSSPERPILRKKSSLNLASLPPRDPLTTKRSIGTSAQPNSTRDSKRDYSTVRDSFLNRNNQPQGPGASANSKDDEVDQSEAGDEGTVNNSSQSESIRLHNKTSTQRLHERITMLGKASLSRPSKSIPSALTNAQAAVRKPEQQDQVKLSLQKMEESEDQDLECIEAVTQAEDPVSQSIHNKKDQLIERNQSLRSTDQPPEIPYPKLDGLTTESTTPAGSPKRWGGDGPLSASKAKFQSFLRSAKGMFASSAAASAQAKMEAMSPAPSRSKLENQPASADEVVAPKGAIVEQTRRSSRKRSASEGPLGDDNDARNDEPPAKRRSSRLMAEKESQTAVKPITKEKSDSQSTRKDEAAFSSQDDVKQSVTEAPASDNNAPNRMKSQPKKPSKPIDATTKVNEPRRPKTVAKSNTVQKSKPGQFSVQLPSMRSQVGASSTSAKPTVQSQSNSGNASGKPGLNKKASDSSLRSASSQNVRTGTANSKLKALENARRKKEQDEREQQRKEEQKKAIERKRAEKAEEERLAQERKLAEQRREVEERAAAQKRAAEQQKIEKQQKEEHLRAQAEASKAKQAREWMLKSQHERVQVPAGSKTEKVPVQPEPHSQDSSRPLVPHVNPAKPPKRYFNADADDQKAEPQEPAKKQQKPSEEFELRTQQQPLARPNMGAPMRASVVKKQELPSKFQHGFMSNASSAQASSSSMLKTAVNTSHQMQQHTQHPKTPHSIQDIAKFANARIPFAEAPNPPGPSSQAQPSRTTQKTPGTAKSIAKSSPAYTNGDNISLPDIATDSEDDDSDDNGFEAPAWTNSPALRQLLEQQQLVDPMKVFGTIAPLNMEEVFKGAGKDRMKKFRDRTSSANWSGPDKLTEEERRKDKEARERLEKAGGWTYEGSLEMEKAQRER